MNKKGFTLIELLTVIALLALIAMITTPIVINLINDSRDRAYKEQVRLLESAAERYVTDNISSFSESRCISAGELYDEGYLATQDIKNPKGGEMNKVRVEKSGDKYTYTYDEDGTMCKN